MPVLLFKYALPSEIAGKADDTVFLYADEGPYDDPSDRDRTATPFRIEVEDSAGQVLESTPVDSLKQIIDDTHDDVVRALLESLLTEKLKGQTL